MQLIRNRIIVDDHWQHVPDEEGVPGNGILPDGNIIVSLSLWHTHRRALLARSSGLGLRLRATDNVDGIAGDLNRFNVIALEFGAFTDGRGYSQARLLRERHRYGGEIRAVGEFLTDQLFFMERCGINAFEIPEGQDVRQALTAFSEITVVYQPSSDRRGLVFEQRRAYAAP